MNLDSHFAFSEEDVKAITLALPLVSLCGSGDPVQDRRNEMLCRSAGQKLLLHTENFDPNEIRVISAAVQAACLLLSGQLPVGVSAEELAELKKHFFTYNKLKAPLDRLLDRLSKQCGPLC